MIAPYKFKSNDWSYDRYMTNTLFNSDGLNDPIGSLGKYKTNDAYTQMKEISKHFKDKRNGIDIGARWGSFTQQLHKEGFKHVFMFEMREYHFRGISFNIDMSRADAYCCAVMDKSGRVSRGGKIVTDTNKGDVPAIAIDDLELPDIDFIKIDVDGPDRLALKGCLRTIIKHKPLIYLEAGKEQFDWELKYGDNNVQRPEDVWEVLEMDYEAIKGPENNYILTPL
tara:strand:- start:369 stop:1043 length:675 start_codon:yes stop_codon:yes gene_type:complete